MIKQSDYIDPGFYKTQFNAPINVKPGRGEVRNWDHFTKLSNIVSSVFIDFY